MGRDGGHRRSSFLALQRISLRSLAAHKLRLALTVLAVVLGTSFVAGAFILTASLSKAFDDIVDGNYEGVDLVLTGAPEAPLPLTLVAQLEQRGDVEDASPQDLSPVVILTGDGDPIQTGGAGAWLLPYEPSTNPDSIVTVVEGTAPTAPGRALINDTAAESAGIEVGDPVTVIDPSGRHDFLIEGINEMDIATGGWAGLMIPVGQYRSEFSDGTTTAQILIRGSGDSTPTALLHSLRAEYPGLLMQTGEQAAEEESAAIRAQLAFLTYILLAFGLIALLVGTFIISNTFSMLIAQRTREFALLRTLALSRRQLAGAVLAEAVIIGALGSALGILAGVGLVEAITAGMTAAGFGFPDAGIGLDAASVVAPLLIGIVATVLSAWVPARRAGAVHPVQSMRSGEQVSAAPLGKRTVFGAVLVLVGFLVSLLAAVVTSWSTGTRGVLLALGTISLVLGVLLASAALARYLFALRGRLGGVVALLARTNLSRNARRTAATSFALTLGVALVAAVGILGASMKESIFGQVDDSLRADAVVTTGLLSTQGIPGQVAGDITEIPGVAGTVPLTWLPLTVEGETAGGVGPGSGVPLLDDDPRQALVLDVTQGSFESATGSPGVGLARGVAERLGLGVGDVATVAAPGLSPLTVEAPVLVVWEDNSAYVPLAVTAPTAEQLVPDRSAWFTQTLFVDFVGDADAESTFTAVTEEVNSYGVLQVLDRYQYRDSSAEQINQLMSIVYALLALSVVIAVLGIINTLALSITERTREFGTLRAVGTHRAQIRRMIVLESVHIAVLGAVSGVIVGVWLGWCLVRVLADQGIERLLVPGDQLLGLLLGAVVVGVIAGLWPAGRAARVGALTAVD